MDDGAAEPARPDGLGTPSPALEIFVDIMSLDCDLLAAAVEDAPQTRRYRLPGNSSRPPLTTVI